MLRNEVLKNEVLQEKQQELLAEVRVAGEQLVKTVAQSVEARYMRHLADQAKNNLQMNLVLRNTGTSKLLTDREREIVILICDGFVTKEISNILGISMRTVDAHRKNIFRKLRLDGCNATLYLVRWAIRQGLVMP